MQGVLTAIVSLVLYGRAVNILGASSGAAFAALSPAMTAIMAIPILGEWPTTADWIAIASISAGVYDRDRRAAAATTGLRLDLHALGFGFAVEGANRSSTRMAERRSLQHQPPEIKVFPFSLAFAFDCDLFQTESEIAKVNWRTPGKRLLDRIFDLAIIGGGVNGCGIARDAAGRGNSVFLCEMNDLASGTSSWSTKLVHGGLRYLEYYEFRLVREALIEREILWQIAPHIIRPLRFVLPHHNGLRPAWLLRLGLFLYDHIGGRNLLPPTRSVDLTRDEVGQPLIPGRYLRGFEYSDCFVDDARLVVLTARDAADRGAEIRTRSRAVEIRQVDGIWQVTVENTSSGERSTIKARALVNAAGAGLAHCGAETVCARPRLHVSEQRRPDCLRHSVPG